MKLRCPGRSSSKELAFMKLIFYDSHSYTTDGSGIDHMKYNHLKKPTVWA